MKQKFTTSLKKPYKDIEGKTTFIQNGSCFEHFFPARKCKNVAIYSLGAKGSDNRFVMHLYFYPKKDKGDYFILYTRNSIDTSGELCTWGLYRLSKEGYIKDDYDLKIDLSHPAAFLHTRALFIFRIRHFKDSEAFIKALKNVLAYSGNKLLLYRKTQDYDFTDATIS